MNIDADSKANIKFDHYPVIAKVHIKLNIVDQKKGPGRKKYTERTEEKKEENNKNTIRKIDGIH